jgi:hypothetical protein
MRFDFRGGKTFLKIKRYLYRRSNCGDGRHLRQPTKPPGGFV